MADTNLTVKLKVQDDGTVVLDQFTRKVEAAGKNIQNSLSIIKLDALVNLGERALRAGEQMYQFGRNVANAANDIERNARTMNMSIETFQQMKYATKMADVEMEGFMQSFRFLTKAMTETSQGTGDAAKAFGILGINIKDSSGKMKDQKTILFEAIDALNKYEDGANRDALMMAIFGRSFLTLKPLVNEGTSSLRDFMTEAEKLGVVVEDGLIKRGGEAEKSFKRLETQIEALKIRLTPAIEKFVNLANAILGAIKAVDEWNSRGVKSGWRGERKDLQEMAKSAELWEKAYGFSSLVGKGEAPPLEEKKGEVKKFGFYEEDLDKTTALYKAAYGERYKVATEEAIKFGDFMRDNEQSETDFFIDQEKLKQEMLEGSTNNQLEIQNNYFAERDAAYNAAQDRIIEGEQEFQKTLTEAWDATNKYYIDEYEKRQQKINSIVETFGSTLSSAWATNLTGMIKGTKNFGDAVKNIFTSIGDAFINTIAKMITNWMIFGSITGEKTGGGYGGLIGVLGKIGGALLGGGGATEGAVAGSSYMPGAVSYMDIPSGAEGLVVNKPTLALIGDAGPEVAVPLKNGKIPIEGGGQKQGGVTVVQIIQTIEPEQWIRKNAPQFIRMITSNLRVGGDLKTPIRGA